MNYAMIIHLGIILGSMALIGFALIGKVCYNQIKEQTK